MKSNSIKKTMRGIKDRLKKENSLTLIQARVDNELYFAFRRQLKKDSVKIKDFFEAAMATYLEESLK